MNGFSRTVRMNTRRHIDMRRMAVNTMPFGIIGFSGYGITFNAHALGYAPRRAERRAGHGRRSLERRAEADARRTLAVPA